MLIYGNKEKEIQDKNKCKRIGKYCFVFEIVCTEHTLNKRKS
jgi:hypothetical protein